MGGSRQAAWRRRGSKALVAAGAVTCLGSAEAVGGWAALGQVPAHRGIGAPSEGARRPSHATHAASTRGALAFASVDKIGQRLERGIEELQAALKKKRLELCPWEEFGIECEKALTYHQLWINPCQGWNQMQQAVDGVARKCHGAAFVANSFWPATLAGMAKHRVLEFGHSKLRAPPFGSYQMESWQEDDRGDATVEDRSGDVQWVNDGLVQASMDLFADQDWEQVSSDAGIDVWRKYLSPDLLIADRRVDRASKFAVVKARAVIDAPVEQVYDLFTDNSRVSEYNEYCKDVRDLAWLDESTKITQSLTGRPWSREFVTRVHYRDMGEGSKLVVNRGEEHPLAVANAGYTRMEMPISANMMRPLPHDPAKTEFTLITHIDPGGFAATQFGAMVTNRLSTESPRTFLAALSQAVTRMTPTGSQHGAAPTEGARDGAQRLGQLQRLSIGAALAAGGGAMLRLAAAGAGAALGRGPPGGAGAARAGSALDGPAALPSDAEMFEPEVFVAAPAPA